MDILRKELNAFYDNQRLSEESLDYTMLDSCKSLVGKVVKLEHDCRVITDAAKDHCYIWGGDFLGVIGLSDEADLFTETDSSDEDEIYNLIHPEDLADKRMLEYEFFRHIDSLPSQNKLDYRATSHLRFKGRDGNYVFVDNTTRILQLSPKGKVWLILCGYNLSPYQTHSDGIAPRIINHHTGEIIELKLSEKRSHILTPREKAILNLIKEGQLSKQIAAELGISVHTVNRHRQNILEKLSVGNSIEAITAATLMRLL